MLRRATQVFIIALLDLHERGWRSLLLGAHGATLERCRCLTRLEEIRQQVEPPLVDCVQAGDLT